MPETRLQTADPASPGELRARYLEALVAPDARRARDLILRAHADGIPAATLYLQVLAPALHEIGRRWERAEVSVAQEHLSTQVTQAVLAQLASKLTGSPDGRSRPQTVVVACTPGELHALGSQMVSDFLEADGYRVLPLGADAPPQELAELSEVEQAEIVCLSTVLPGNLLAAARAFGALRRLPDPPLLIAGGQAYGGDAARAQAVGADAFAADPEELLTLLAERFPG